MRKGFFFGKKKQKTFFDSGAGLRQRQRLIIAAGLVDQSNPMRQPIRKTDQKMAVKRDKFVYR
jgi:hypothetical protein